MILGLLLPATENPEADRDVFLALMTMDEDGLLRRWKKAIPAGTVWEYTSPRDRDRLFEPGKVAWKRSMGQEERRRVQRRAFLAKNYDSKLE